MFTAILNQNSNTPLYEQLYKHIKSLIESGKIAPNEKLPSKRSLSAHLKISRSTIETAYNQLLAEGYIRSKPGSGYYAEEISSKLISLNTSCKPIISDINPITFKPLYDLKTNGVDCSCFPFSVWTKLSREVLSENPQEILLPSHPQGIPSLRNEITRYLYNFRGMTVKPEQIIVGAGSEFLMSIVVQLLGRNKIFGIENPGYHKISKILQFNGVATIPITIDKSGITVNQLDKLNVSAVHVTPSHHFPLGIVMPVTRRNELLQWADSSPQNFIIEDDYDSEFRFTGRPIPSLQSMDRNSKVIYMNTFTKTIAPSLRISYLVLPDKLLSEFKNQLFFYSSTVPNFEQFTLCKFMSKGYLERHINRMRNIYRNRRNLLISALSKSRISQYISISSQNSGLHFLLSVNNGMSENQLVSSASANHVRVYGLSQYYYGQQPPNTLPSIVIGYSLLPSDKIDDCVKLLEQSWL